MATEKKEVIKFNKEQILSSKKFTVIERDILTALLEDKQYSLEEVDKVLKEYREEVK
ncbi:hypothetical protein [Clostridium botulinum]|uniref:hypothetical protein n=1 Tax=Clostridium botulinum TaxID=1491 RepID=UPI000AF82378|nr:hypothetical protein [Clostridium botulinum]